MSDHLRLTPAREAGLRALAAARHPARASIRTDPGKRPVWVHKRVMAWLAAHALAEEIDANKWVITLAGKQTLHRLDHGDNDRRPK